MQYLVDMKLAAYGRPTGGPQDGVSFIEQFILPSLELCQKLEVEKKILAGGPANGAIRLVMIVSAESAQELDEIIASLPIWPQMETAVTPLMTVLSEHPTVKWFQERAGAATVQATSQGLNAEWLRQICLEAGADDVGFVEIDRPGLADQRDDILSFFPQTKTLISI